MSRADRRGKAESQLAALEAEFEHKLIVALKSCASGEWGFFESNPPVRNLREGGRAAAAELRTLGDRIVGLRDRLGFIDEYWFFARLRRFQAMFDNNDPGEPKRAKAFLAEIEARRPSP